MPVEEIASSSALAADLASANPTEPSPVNSPDDLAEIGGGDTLTGTVTVHNANWQADYLAGHIVVNAATLHIANRDLRWDPVEFSYGPLKGTATLTLPASCMPEQAPQQPCRAQFQMQFADLDASAFESALLGAPVKGTLLSNLINRIHPSSSPSWPQLDGTVTADSLVLGPVTLQSVAVSLRIVPSGAEITGLDASLFGGTVHLAGTLTKPASESDKPDYALGGDFQKLNAADVGRLLGVRWTGGALSGNGNLDVSGYTDADLASSAKGSLVRLNNIQELKNQIEQLLKDRRGWQERTMFHIINVDPKTAAISYQDADSKTPTVIASREIAGKLIERHKKESENQPGEKRELYYYFLYPRPQPLDFPNRGQEAKLREYKKWFDEAKVANSLKENFP